MLFNGENMEIIIMLLGILVFIAYKIGQAQGEIKATHQLKRKTVILYANKEQLETGFAMNEMHVLTKHKQPNDVPVKVIYESR